MIRLKKGFIFTFIFFVNSFAFGHGENKYGPNGGFIKMPGAFHTELKLEGQGIRIWLHDIEFKNPTISNSSVELDIISKNKKNLEKIQCSPEKKYFICKTNSNLNEIKNVKVRAIRSNQKGIEVEYLFPLTLSENIHDKH